MDNSSLEDAIDPMKCCQDCLQPYCTHNQNPVEGNWPTFKLLNDEVIDGALCPPKQGWWCENCKTFHPTEYPCPKTFVKTEGGKRGKLQS